ncbi:MAG TPA: CPBP family glutamic-type intramembrane protease [Polyangiaceae bacterium]|nr:CPBP family glutamic-type intramembrane protease [Polyangiaceae bacterium]
MKAVALVFAAVVATYAVAFRPDLADSSGFYVAFGVPHLVLAAFAAQSLARRGKLVPKLMPKAGDLSLGALAGFALLVASWAARSVLTPAASPRQNWLLRLYLQLGDPEKLQHSVFLTVALSAIVVAEELVWRGFVLDAATERFGTRRGWLVAAGLYALAALPTVYLQRDPVAGLNPLLVMAAFGCGLVWTFLSGRFGRLLPSTVAHLVFTYFSATQFQLPLLPRGSM